MSVALVEHPKQQEQSSTNRPRVTPIFGVVPGEKAIGIDTIKVSGGVRSHALQRLRLQRVVNGDTGEWEDHVTGGLVTWPSGVALHVRQQHDSVIGYFEVSVPNHLAGTNSTAATLDAGKDLVLRLHGEAQEYLTWDSGPEALLTSRLDIVRDFHGIEHEQRLLDTLHLAPGPAVRLNLRYRNDHKGGAETLTRGTPGRVTGCLYSKYAERLFQPGSTVP